MLINSKSNESQRCLQKGKLQEQLYDSHVDFVTDLDKSQRLRSIPHHQMLGHVSQSDWFKKSQQAVQNSYPPNSIGISQHKYLSFKSLLLALALTLLILIAINFSINYGFIQVQALSHNKRVFQEAQTQLPLSHTKSVKSQKSPQQSQTNDVQSTNTEQIEQNHQIQSRILQSNDSNSIMDQNQPQQQESDDYLNDPTIQWPKQNELYHIYSALNPHLVLDVAVAKDGYHDLILYDWKNQLNQMYQFQNVKENYYHIINAQSKEYMKKSEKFITSSNVSKIKFSKQPAKLWKLIPAKPKVNNSFYIVSQDSQPREALDLNEGYAKQFAEIIQYKFHKFSNQVWVLRKNIDSKDINEKSTQKLQEKASQLLYNVMHIPDSINEAITLEEMKLQMKKKNIPLPFWLKKPAQNRVDDYDLPLQTTQKDFMAYLKAKKAQLDSKNPSIIDNKVSSEVEDDEDKDDEEEKPKFAPPLLAVECAKNHKVAYIWYGGQEMPQQYEYLLQKCKDNVVLLTQLEFQAYLTEWNDLSTPKYQIIPEIMPVRQRVNMLKLLYLYFQSGIYADFDTQINEDCFEKVYANQIIFTNRVEENIKQPLFFPVEEIVVPEESFMMVRRKKHPQVKRMIEEQILEHENGGGDRWRECKYRQCLIVQCQRHYRDNTYRKGYV